MFSVISHKTDLDNFWNHRLLISFSKNLSLISLFFLWKSQISFFVFFLIEI